jgi:hypothetical protein
VITHKVTVWRPPAAKHTPNLQLVHNRHVTITTQYDYNEYLNKVPFNIGDFVTLCMDRQLKHLFNVHYVSRIETDIKSVNWAGTKPRPYLLVACGIPTNSTLAPWTRWDTMDGLRLLSAEEYDELIKPDHDNIQSNCIQSTTEWLKTSSTK